MLRRSTSRPERTRVWRELWRRDKARALQACDDIVQNRAVPQRLLDRLGIVSKKEKAEATGRLRGTARPVTPEDMPTRKGKGSR